MATAFYPSPNTMAISGFVPEPTAAQTPQPEEQYISTFFCRALYDYQTNDTSSLSFHKNDIIEVLTRLESGWWDGLLGDERGWFPSNYVAVISDQEAEAAFSSSEPSAAQSAVASSSTAVDNDPVVDMALTMSRSLSGSSRDDDWLESDLDYQAPATQQSQQQQAPQPQPARTQTTQTNGHTNGHSDFWVPQVSQDGRIFYVNTQTGQHSQDLPQEVEPDGDLAALSPSATRPVNTAVVLAEALGQAVTEDSNSNGAAGFGVPRRSRTPEPWSRRLADDGLSYYYQNKQTGQVSWTLPDSNDPPAYEQTQSSSSTMASSLTTQRLRSGSTASQTHKRSASVYSDDSDVQPMPGGRNRTESSAATSRTAVTGAIARPPIPRPSGERLALTDAEEIAKSVQTALFPAPPESPMELAQHVRDAVTTVTDFLQATGPSRRPEQAKEIDSRVLDVVAAVRNLLYVTATPTGHVPSHLYPRGPESRSSTGLQTHLKAAHRKVAGTLSKLVLSALALQYDPTQAVGDKPNRMEGDAKELERSVVQFVAEVQKYQEQYVSPNGAKRLLGVYGTENVGLALPGAGNAASWKGFGYVATTPGSDPPARSLQSEVITESRTFLNALNSRLNELVEISHNNTEHLQAEGQSIIAYLSALLAFINEVNVAQHVDIDGLRAESGATASYSRYIQTVDRARFLLRKLELSTQALYDDSASLFMTIQQTHVPEPYYDLLHVDRSVQHHQIENLVSVISSNLAVTIDVMDGLFTVGREQANIGQAAYHESIKWRQSRLSIWDGNIDPFMQTPLPPTQEEDVVDLADAFARPGVRSKPSLSNASAGSTTLYENGTRSDLSLNMSERSRSEDPNEPITPTWPHQDAAGPSTYVRTGSSPEEDELPLEESSSPLFDDFDDEGPSVKAHPRAAHKLMKLLGAEAPQHYLAKLTAEAKPWYLRPNYDQSEILIDPDGAVRAGTTTALVERLTAHEHGDPTFIKNFLMTFRSFMTLQDLFDLLVTRFWIQPPPNLNPTELADWKKLKQHVIRMRVLNTFKTMVTDEEMLEKDDLWILDKLKEFASDPEVVSAPAAKQLLILIERAGGDGPIKTTQMNLPSPPPPPILPKSSKKLKLLDIDPTELGRQLTLMEATLYKRIRPMECLMRSRESKPGKLQDNITSIIQLSNRIANWVADSILEREDSRKRAIIVKHFINVADRCRGLQNYSTMVAIISGLNTPPIRRLKRTWEQVNAKLMTQLSNCESTIDTNKNFANYRQTLASISPPAVPFIGVYLTTLTFINDGAEDKLAGQMINFRKRQKAAEVIQDIKRWQSMPFSLTSVGTILSFLEDSFNKYVDGVDYGDQFWNLSLEREPREREDEKMARLLQESGFL